MLIIIGSLLFVAVGGHEESPPQDKAADALTDLCGGIVIKGKRLTKSHLAKATSARDYPYTLWTIGDDRGTFTKHSCERVRSSPRRNKELQYEVLTRCDGLPTTLYFPDEEAAVDFAVQWGHLEAYEVDATVLREGRVAKNPFSRFALFKKKLTAAHVNFGKNWKAVKRYLKIGSKTYAYCEQVTSGPTSYSDNWKLRVTCTKENSKKTKTFDIEFLSKDSAMSFATIWGGYTTEVPMSARMVGGSNIKAAEILVSPSTGRARKRILRLQDNKARICRAVNDVIYKGDAADVVVVCDKQLHTIPFDAYQRAERFAAVWGGFKKVDEDVVGKCSKMEIAGQADTIARATSDVVSLGRKIASGRLETSEGSMLRCARVNEPVSYEGGIDKYVVKTKCQDRTTRIICDDEDAAWRFSAQWSHFRAGVSTNLGLVSASTRVDLHHNGKHFLFTLTAANVESHLRYAGTSTKDDRDLSRKWFVCSKVKTIKETDNGEFHVVTTCGLSLRNRIPSPEDSNDEVEVVFAKREQAQEFASQWGQYNPMNAHDVGVIYSAEPMAGVVAAGYYRDTFSGKLSGRVLTTRDAAFECGAVSAMEQQIDGDVHLRTECSGERKTTEKLSSADTTLVLKRAETAVKWAVRWGDIAKSEIYMSSDMVSDSTASVQDQVTGTVNVAKLVYASTGALQTRVIEVLCGSTIVRVTFPSQELGIAFARYFGGMQNANIESDAGFIGSCPSAVIGTGGVHDLKHARLRKETGTGEVVKAGASTRINCDGLQQNPRVGSDGVEISISCYEETSGTPKKLELLCDTPSDAVSVCKGPLFEKQDAVVEVSSRVRSACDVVTISGQSSPMRLTSASIQDSAVVVDIAGADESNTRRVSCTHFFGSPEVTDHQTLVLHAQCGEEVLNFECKDTAAALQLAAFGQIDQPAIALQQGVINSCAEVRQEGISNAFSLSKATYRPSFAKSSGYSLMSGSGQDLKRWLTVTLRNDDEPSYEDSHYLLSCSAVSSMPEPYSALDRNADKYKVSVECDNAEGMSGNTKVEVLCDDSQSALQLSTMWGSLESTQMASIELTSLHTQLKAAWLDAAKVDSNKVHMFVANPDGEHEEGSILQIGSSSYKCDPKAPHRVYFKQFFYYVTMRCNELSADKMTLGDSHKVTLIASSEEGALTMARAFAKLPVDKVWIDHTLYFADEEGDATLGDTQAALTEAYIKVFPREYVLDFSGAFQYSCNEVSQAPRYTARNRYKVMLTCGKRDGDTEPEQKEQVVTVAFSTPSKAIGFSNAFGGSLYHEVDIDPTIIRTVDYISSTPEQYMGRGEIYPLKRATVRFDLNGHVTSRRIEFLRADQFYGSDTGKRTYHPVKFDCDEKLMQDRKADQSGRIVAATLTATCVETYSGFHQQRDDRTKVLMSFRRSPDAVETFMSWWRGNFRTLDTRVS
ncbi:hypothetical protein Pmar_PMAR019671 [Perkinsus marinus ATCC 50983]|uniref:Uncharacterized protein n=1 Tax=Perkinsus marinus (strain ATCC 50983 / TXsc) TaxID=423536 RepID=C5LF53_PERM5|nr:hypothetical protein Pmar_PMAR019671 [Perkinsus marinus ATCC 50983]EER04637.1 hypothetical protein Pmar_PMAR019671 [Perkinsus marinus ATCC 50983]|eukprot:XP_002772821.1 hypothetical protein Pmar_PMAR019671 [Perkinsus marinus ATCC 50983]